jgi:hypothetical protein
MHLWGAERAVVNGTASATVNTVTLGMIAVENGATMKPFDLQLTAVHNGREQAVQLYAVFHYDNSNCRLCHLLIFADGTILFNSQCLDLEGLVELVKQGVIRTTLPDHERLYIPELVDVKVAEVILIVEEEEFLKEVGDILRELNGLPTTSDLCRSAYREYLGSPSEQGRHRLREAYEDVPKHLDVWLLGFPEKDAPIREILYGKER